MVTVTCPFAVGDFTPDGTLNSFPPALQESRQVYAGTLRRIAGLQVSIAILTPALYKTEAMIRSYGPSAPKTLAFSKSTRSLVDIDVIQGSEAARGSKQADGVNSHREITPLPNSGLT